MTNEEQRCILYSYCEDFTHASDDADEAVDELIDEIISANGYINYGWHEIFSGESAPMMLTDFISIDKILELARDGVSEYSDSVDYSINVTAEQSAELKYLIQKWADKHKLNPDVNMVNNVRAVKVFISYEMVMSAMEDCK